MIGYIAILIGLLITAGVVYYYKDGIKAYFKKNKKKIMAVGTAGALLGTGIAIMPEAYRPDTSTFIVCSDGRIYPPTNAYLQTAITDSDAGESVGMGSNITIITTLTMKEDVNVNLKGHTLISSTNTNIVDMRPCVEFGNGKIDVSSCSDFTDIAVLFDSGDGSYNINDNSTRLYNLDIIAGNFAWETNHDDYNGTGIEFRATKGNAVCFVQFDTVKTLLFQYGFVWNCTDANAAGGSDLSFMNGNIIHGYVDSYSEYGFYQMPPANEYCRMNGNIFSDLMLEGDNMTVGLQIEGKYNMFDGMIWDIPTGSLAINLTSNSEGNYFQFHMNNTKIRDNGTQNFIINRRDSRLSCTQIKPYKDNVSLEFGASGTTGDLYLNRYEGDDVQVFANNPNTWLKFLINGNNSAEKLGFYWNTPNEGQFIIEASGTNDILMISGDDFTVRADDDIVLTANNSASGGGAVKPNRFVVPMTADATTIDNPENGMIAFITGNQTQAIYYSGTWYYYNHI